MELRTGAFPRMSSASFGLVSPGSGIMRFSYSHHILMVQRANACSVRELRANLPNDDFTQLFVPPWARQIVEIAHSDAI